jgi:hypothetical protein
MNSEQFNKFYGKGVTVAVTLGTGRNEIKTSTRSPAWERGEGNHVVMVHGVVGDVPLYNCRVLETQH